MLNCVNRNYCQFIKQLSWLVLVLLLTGCASRLEQVNKVPEEVNIDVNGSWQFVSQDEKSHERFTRIARQQTSRITAEIIQRGQSLSARRQNLPDRMLLDVLISLLSLPREELFIKQTPKSIAVDYGVAGYHSFMIGEATKLNLGGAELDAIAGWQNNSLLIHILVTNEFDIYQRFRLMDDRNLLETMEIELQGNDRISHQRWYRRKD